MSTTATEVKTTTTTTTTTTAESRLYDYDMIIIGGGSGGMAAARRASQIYDKKVALIEGNRLGGTCVNVGCVPKKIMYQTASIYEIIKHHGQHYNITTGASSENDDNTNSYSENVQLDWRGLKTKRDKYIQRLNSIYWNGLTNANVTLYDGWGKFINEHTIEITTTENNDDGTTRTQVITGQHVVIATGSKPYLPIDDNKDDYVIGAKEYAITSNEFFNTLDTKPKKVVMVGSGYIAVELASMLAMLDIETHLIIRHNVPLRTFDNDISTTLHNLLLNNTPNLHVHYNTLGIKEIHKVTESNNDTNNTEKVPLYNVTLVQSGCTNNTTTGVPVPVVENVDCVILAIGRVPNTDGLGLETVNIKTNKNDEIMVNEYQTTSIGNIYALGDVCDVGYELTPVAIAAGRRLSDRLFSNHPSLKDVAKIDYTSTRIPTVVFTHPPIGTVGLTETQAIAQYGSDNIKIYRSTFVNLYYSMFDTIQPQNKPKTLIKLIVTGPTEIVIGLHMIGLNVDEILQGFAVAISLGTITKNDFDNCIAIHPTAAEEIVTLHPWGLSNIDETVSEDQTQLSSL